MAVASNRNTLFSMLVLSRVSMLGLLVFSQGAANAVMVIIEPASQVQLGVISDSVVEAGTPAIFLNSSLTSDPSFQTRARCGSASSGTSCSNNFKCCEIGDNTERYYCCPDYQRCCQGSSCCGSGGCPSCQPGKCPTGDGTDTGNNNDTCRRNQICCNHANRRHYCCPRRHKCCNGKCCEDDGSDDNTE